MLRWFQRLFGHKPQRPARTCRLGLEDLEGGDVPAAPVLSPQGVLSMTATNKGDQILIQVDNNATPYNHFDDVVRIHWARGGGKIEDYAFKRFALGPYGLQLQIRQIQVEGGNGNDTIENDTFIASELRGNDGNDVLRGGSNDDLLEGGMGADVLYGNDGKDVYALYQGQWGTDASSVDVQYGGKGIDRLHGGRRGVNLTYGGDNNDILLGGENASNTMFGESGNDFLSGGDGPSAVNVLVGGSGKDVLVAGAGGFNILNAYDGATGYGTQDEIHPAATGYTVWYYDPDGSGVGDHVFAPSDTYVQPPEFP
jgi:Ca2+-binding RTX toxin-like protein